MATTTVIGVFDSAEDAQTAASELYAAGFTTDTVDVASRAAAAVKETAEDAGDGISTFFSSLFGSDTPEQRSYSAVASRAGSTITVHAHSAENAHRAAEIMDNNGAVDADERVSQYAAGADTDFVRTDADAQTLKVIREDLQVGKRTVETGGARLRARIVERPVEESVRLREEHVRVERTAVNRPATEADFQAFQEGEIELREHAERAVVGKEARVIEEISLGKETTEREETIRETVRSTEVDVERIASTEGDVTRTTRTGMDGTTTPRTDR